MSLALVSYCRVKQAMHVPENASIVDEDRDAAERIYSGLDYSGAIGNGGRVRNGLAARCAS